MVWLFCETQKATKVHNKWNLFLSILLLLLWALSVLVVASPGRTDISSKEFRGRHMLLHCRAGSNFDEGKDGREEEYRLFEETESSLSPSPSSLANHNNYMRNNTDNNNTNEKAYKDVITADPENSSGISAALLSGDDEDDDMVLLISSLFENNGSTSTGGIGIRPLARSREEHISDNITKSSNSTSTPAVVVDDGEAHSSDYDKDCDENYDDGNLITPQTDLTLPGRHFHIVTTAALPWFTGTAVNPLLRAAYLHRRTIQINNRYKNATNATNTSTFTANDTQSSWVTLVIPWLEFQDDQQILYGKVFDNATHQECYIRQWLEQDAKMPDVADPNTGLNILFYPARYHAGLGSIFAMGDICNLINQNHKCGNLDVCILEEPEHCNWFRAPGDSWTSRFKYVIGIVHTNYQQYANSYFTGFATAPAITIISRAMVRAYCHQVIKLSDVLQTFALEKEVTSNVHGVRGDFLEEGQRRAIEYYINNKFNSTSKDAESSLQNQTCSYFIGKLLWAKGLDILLELQDYYRQCTGDYFPIDIYGKGPEEEETDIRRAFLGRPRSQLSILGTNITWPLVNNNNHGENTKKRIDISCEWELQSSPSSLKASFPLKAKITIERFLRSIQTTITTVSNEKTDIFKKKSTELPYFLNNLYQKVENQSLNIYNKKSAMKKREIIPTTARDEESIPEFRSQNTSTTQIENLHEKMQPISLSLNNLQIRTKQKLEQFVRTIQSATTNLTESSSSLYSSSDTDSDNKMGRRGLEIMNKKIELPKLEVSTWKNKMKLQLLSLKWDNFSSDFMMIQLPDLPFKRFAELRKRPIPANFLGRVDHSSLTGKYKIFINPSISEVLCTTTAEALAMGKFVIIPVHPSNNFFMKFPNCLPYNNKFEFVANLKYALNHEPAPLTPELQREFTWEAATDRLIEASSITYKEARDRETLGLSKIDERIAWFHNEVLGKGVKGDILRKAFGGGPVSNQVKYQKQQQQKEGISEEFYTQELPSSLPEEEKLQGKDDLSFFFVDALRDFFNRYNNLHASLLRKKKKNQ